MGLGSIGSRTAERSAANGFGVRWVLCGLPCASPQSPPGELGVEEAPPALWASVLQIHPAALGLQGEQRRAELGRREDGRPLRRRVEAGPLVRAVDLAYGGEPPADQFPEEFSARKHATPLGFSGACSRDALDGRGEQQPCHVCRRTLRRALNRLISDSFICRGGGCFRAAPVRKQNAPFPPPDKVQLVSFARRTAVAGRYRGVRRGPGLFCPGHASASRSARPPSLTERCR